jgi:hypothetical protein
MMNGYATLLIRPMDGANQNLEAIRTVTKEVELSYLGASTKSWSMNMPAYIKS